MGEGRKKAGMDKAPKGQLNYRHTVPEFIALVREDAKQRKLADEKLKKYKVGSFEEEQFYIGPEEKMRTEHGIMRGIKGTRGYWQSHGVDND